MQSKVSNQTSPPPRLHIPQHPKQATQRKLLCIGWFYRGSWLTKPPQNEIAHLKRNKRTRNFYAAPTEIRINERYKLSRKSFLLHHFPPTRASIKSDSSLSRIIISSNLEPHFSIRGVYPDGILPQIVLQALYYALSFVCVFISPSQ